MYSSDNNQKNKRMCNKALSIWNIEILVSNFTLQFSGVLVNGFVISVYLVDVLKASPAFIGLISGIAMFQGLLQPFSAMVVRKIKRRKLFTITALFISRIIYFSSLIYGYFASINGDIIFPLIAILCFIATIVQSLSLELNSWFVDLTNIENRGKHLIIRSTLTNIGAMAGILLSGLVLRYTDNIHAFAIIFIISFVFFIAAFIIFFQAYDPPKQTKMNVPIKEMFKPILKDKNYIAFLFTVALSNIGVYITMPFFNTFYLEYLHMPYDILGFANAASTLVLAFGFFFWGRMMGLFGARLLSKITILLLAFIPLLWLFVSPTKNTLPHMVLIMLLYSFAQGGWGIAQSTVAYNIGKEEHSTAYTSLYFATVAFCAFTAPNIGGLFIEFYGEHRPFSTDISIKNPIMITFILSFIINMICVIVYPTYKIHRDRSNLRLRDVLIRVDAVSVLYRLTAATFIPNLIGSRKKLAAEMGETKTVVALPKLVSMLDDLEQSVRLSAIEAIGQIPDIDAKDILINFSKEANILEQQAIIQSLGNFHDKDTIEFLTNIYTSKFPLLRMSAANALSKHPNDGVKEIALWWISTKKYKEHDFIAHLAVLAANKAYEAIPDIIKHYNKMKDCKHKEQVLYYLSIIFNIEKSYYKSYYQDSLKSCKKNINKMIDTICSLDNIKKNKNKKLDIEREFEKLLFLISSEEGDVSFIKYSNILTPIILNKTEKEKFYAIEYFMKQKKLTANEINFLSLSINEILKQLIKIKLK